MAETVQRNLPAQFIEDLGRDYGKQLSALTQLPIDTSQFAPQVAAQDALQTQAYQQATDAAKGLGAYDRCRYRSRFNCFLHVALPTRCYRHGTYRI